ncbi:hypothetical protein JCM30760_27160 [Thiomicrorhabdus hydrogeniphila]
MSDKVQIRKELFNEIFDIVEKELDEKINNQTRLVIANANYKDINHYRDLEKREEALRSFKNEWINLKND